MVQVVAAKDASCGRGTARAEDARGTPTQMHIPPSILVYEDKRATQYTRGRFEGGNEPDGSRPEVAMRAIAILGDRESPHVKTHVGSYGREFIRTEGAVNRWRGQPCNFGWCRSTSLLRNRPSTRNTIGPWV